MKKLDTPALRVLEMLNKYAPKIPLCTAYAHLKEYQEYRDEIEKAQYMIVVFLEDILGFNEHGHLSDPEMAKRLKDAPIEVWSVLDMALNIHAGYACSPFTPKDWKKQMHKKHSREDSEIEFKKKMQYENKF